MTLSCYQGGWTVLYTDWGKRWVKELLIDQIGVRLGLRIRARARVKVTLTTEDRGLG